MRLVPTQAGIGQTGETRLPRSGDTRGQKHRSFRERSGPESRLRRGSPSGVTLVDRPDPRMVRWCEMRDARCEMRGSMRDAGRGLRMRMQAGNSSSSQTTETETQRHLRAQCGRLLNLLSLLSLHTLVTSWLTWQGKRSTKLCSMWSHGRPDSIVPGPSRLLSGRSVVCLPACLVSVVCLLPSSLPRNLETKFKPQGKASAADGRT